jgi:Fe-S-cluster-containing hydrogenase component 2
MKNFLSTNPDNCLACRLCENTCSNLYFKAVDPERSRIRIAETAAQPEMNVCNQCETCVKTCPTLALSVNHRGVVMVDKSMCINCYMCIAVCPTGSMFRYQGDLTPFKCVACGACAKTCPADAIRISQTKE